MQTHNNHTNHFNHTPNNISQNPHSNHTNHQQTQFNNHPLKFQLLEEFPQQIKHYLTNFEITQIPIIKSVLLKAKKSFNNPHHTYYPLQHLHFQLLTLLKPFKPIFLQKNQTLQPIQPYFMQSIKAELQHIHPLNIPPQNIPNYNIFNQ
ncbi:hypothetical protein [Staphylococcus saprophyticus]|uniref:hypothetical protein n=1 Tax=Staphylococcus saprophyticus TaxID=29385 RepID=UPI002981DC6F|nr:hypothetical protein [Staphylococcus saprophyticus]